MPGQRPNGPSVIELFFHRDLTLRVSDERLTLAVSQELFSSHAIDTGTLLLIKFLERSQLPVAERVLDLGTGYGPLALAAKRLWPGARVVAVDRDALAVDYTAFNAERNEFDVDVSGSLGFDDVGPEERFDLIVSNVPGKGGPIFHELLLLGAAPFLRPNGLMAVVVVNPLVELLQSWQADARIEIVAIEPGRQHTVVCFKPTGRPARFRPAFPRAYGRGDMTVGRKRVSYRLSTVHGLAEFDQLGFQTELLFDLLPRRGGGDRAVVWNPGQGHVVGGLTANTRWIHIEVLDRDLLALRNTERFCMSAGVPAAFRHVAHPTSVDFGDGVDLAVCTLRPKEPAEASAAGVEQLLSALQPSGALLLSGRSTDLRRVVDRVVKNPTANGPRAYRVEREVGKRGHLGVRVVAKRSAPGAR